MEGVEVTLRRATRAELWQPAIRQPMRPPRRMRPWMPPRRPALNLTRRVTASCTRMGRSWALWAAAWTARGTAGPALGREAWARLGATLRRIGWPWPGPAQTSLPPAVSVPAPGVPALHLTVPLTLRFLLPTVAQQAGVLPSTAMPAAPAVPAALSTSPRRPLAPSSAPSVSDDATASILATARFASSRQRLTLAVEPQLAPLWAREAETVARQAVYLPRSQLSRLADEGAVGMWLEQAQAMQPVTRVLARPAPAPMAPPAPNAPAAPAPGTPALRYWDQAQPPRTPAFSAGDIDRLTDQVIKTLDERLISARERLGKPGRG